MTVPPRSRCSGCLLGGALGDALGYPIEFERPRAAIIARYGSAAPERLSYHGASAGLVSDDTQMTLFTAEGLIRARLAGREETTPSLLQAYQRWYGTQAMRPPRTPLSQVPRARGLLLSDVRLHARRAPGNTCLSALAASFMGRSMPTLDSPPNDSKGCGAVMRSAPFGLVANSREQAFQQARDAGVLTHGHPSGYLSAAYFASLIFDLARGAALTESLHLADAILAKESGAEELTQSLARATELAQRGPPSLDTIEAFGGGWTGEEALGIAVVCALTAGGGSSRDMSNALWRSVAHGGDSDSTGSLVGNLLGAMHGDEALPAAWLSELELCDLIARLGADLWTAFFGNAVLDSMAYPVH